MEGYTAQKKKLLNLNNVGLFVIISLAILLLAALGTTYYFYQKSHSVVSKDPQKELDQTIKMIGKHLVLPDNEVPTMATVSDPEKLRDQPFFIKAKKGDKVLIYADSQKAILYDPVADRIVEVAPINASTATQAQNAQSVPASTIKE